MESRTWAENAAEKASDSNASRKPRPTSITGNRSGPTRASTARPSGRSPSCSPKRRRLATTVHRALPLLRTYCWMNWPMLLSAERARNCSSPRPRTCWKSSCAATSGPARCSLPLVQSRMEQAVRRHGGGQREAHAWLNSSLPDVHCWSPYPKNPGDSRSDAGMRQTAVVLNLPEAVTCAPGAANKVEISPALNGVSRAARATSVPAGDRAGPVGGPMNCYLTSSSTLPALARSSTIPKPSSLYLSFSKSSNHGNCGQNPRSESS